MDPLSPVDLDDATFILTRPFDLQNKSLSSTLSHASSRSHCLFSMTNEDTQNQLWPSRTPAPSHETKSSSSQSSMSSSPKSQSSSLSSSSSSSSLTCSVCHKKYANNSTLRRHQKIHVYAKNESRASLTSRLPPLLPPGVFSSLTIPFATTSSTSSSTPIAPLLGRLVLPTDTSGVSTTERHTVQGYSPGSDPDIKKPECVGCGKAFARRDTVILHIKNQKRHWDEFVAMREQWTCEKKASLSLSSSSSGVPSTNLSVLGAEENDDIFEFELDDVDAISVEDEWEEEDDEDEDVEERDEEGDAEMYDIELVANMDAPQKFEWIMRAMKMPPCWKERKVRLFGAFGILEESVLQ
ncbi:hypothetical protein BG000_000329 [Podila horticola]|nr:hypothetical protein BG000_000329 [Podila horticola]